MEKENTTPLLNLYGIGTFPMITLDSMNSASTGNAPPTIGPSENIEAARKKKSITTTTTVKLVTNSIW